MKKIIFLLMFIIPFTSILAQNDKTQNDTTKIRLGNKTIIIIGKNSKSQKIDNKIQITKDSIKISDEEEDIQIIKNKKYNFHKYSRWNGLFLGFNQFVIHNAYGQSLKDDMINWSINSWKSTTWNINIFEYSLSPVKRYVLLTTGLGFEFRKYSFDKNIDIINDNNGKILPVKNDINDYLKNNLTASYVQVPLMLEIHTSPKAHKGIYLGIGVIGGYKMMSETMQKYKKDDKKYKIEIHDDFELNPYQLEGTFRVGFNRFTIFTNVDILPVFKKDALSSNDNLANITIGLKLL